MNTMADVPPYGDAFSVTRMPCRSASWLTTNRPSCSLSDGLNSGGLASRSLSSARRCGLIPSPRSSTSIAKPLATASPDTRTDVYGGDNVVAFSTSSASRWMTSATAEPASAAWLRVATETRA